MKRVLSLLIMLVVTLSLTSCYEFNRKQKLRDAENNGASILAEAESSKKVLIQTAKAENEAAELIASSRITIAKAKKQEKIIDAEAIAEANRIIGESLKNNPEYLMYLKIEAIREAKGAVYVATEASVPILELKE